MARHKTSKSIAADIDRTFRENLRLLEESMAGLPKNSRAYLDRVLARNKLQQSWRDERVSRGLDVQNLGIATKPKFFFIATIDEQPAQLDAKRQAFEEEMDREFPSPAPTVPAAPAGKKKSKTKGTQ